MHPSLFNGIMLWMYFYHTAIATKRLSGNACDLGNMGMSLKLFLFAFLLLWRIKHEFKCMYKPFNPVKSVNI